MPSYGSNPPIDAGSGYFSTEHFQALYDYYTMRVRYTYQSGAYQQHVSGPTNYISSTSVGAGSGITPAELVQLESPSMKVTVGWEAKRIGDKPSIPSPFPPLSAPFTLIGFDFGGESPKLMEDAQTYIFTASGTYLYALATPILPGDSYQLGALPYQVFPTSIMVIGVNQFRDTIFNLGNIGG